MEYDWFFYIVLATFMYGMMNFFFKVAAVHNCPSHLVVNRSAATISILALISLIVTESEFTDFRMILFFGIINSTFFGLGSISKITALKKAPSSLVFPVTKMNAVFVIIISLFLFNDRPTTLQWTGIAMSLFMLLLISLDAKNDKSVSSEKNSSRDGVLLALLAASCTTISMLTGKFASTSVPKLNYIFVSYSMVMIYTFLINKFVHKKTDKIDNKKTLIFGAIIGSFNFIGYYLVLNAFAIGPLSLIQTIFSNSFIIPIILSVFIFKEKLDRKKYFIVLIAIISIILLKIDVNYLMEIKNSIFSYFI